MSVPRLRTESEKQAYVDGFESAVRTVEVYGLAQAKKTVPILRDTVKSKVKS